MIDDIIYDLIEMSSEYHIKRLILDDCKGRINFQHKKIWINPIYDEVETFLHEMIHHYHYYYQNYNMESTLEETLTEQLTMDYLSNQGNYNYIRSYLDKVLEDKPKKRKQRNKEYQRLKCEKHNEVIDCLEEYLKHTDRILDKDRLYFKEFEYLLNNGEKHEADLMCLMDNRAYLFEVKTGNKSSGKAKRQLNADEKYIRQTTDIDKIYKFYVSGLPNDYTIKRVR